MSIKPLGALERAWIKASRSGAFENAAISTTGKKTKRGRPRKYAINPRLFSKGNPEGRTVVHYVQVWLPPEVEKLRKNEPYYSRTTDAIREVMKRLGYTLTQDQVNAYKRVVDRARTRSNNATALTTKGLPEVFSTAQSGAGKTPRSSEEMVVRQGVTIRRHHGTYGGG